VARVAQFRGQTRTSGDKGGERVNYPVTGASISDELDVFTSSEIDALAMEVIPPPTPLPLDDFQFLSRQND